MFILKSRGGWCLQQSSDCTEAGRRAEAEWAPATPAPCERPAPRSAPLQPAESRNPPGPRVSSPHTAATGLAGIPTNFSRPDTQRVSLAGGSLPPAEAFPADFLKNQYYRPHRGCSTPRPLPPGRHTQRLLLPRTGMPEAPKKSSFTVLLQLPGTE